MENSKKYFIKNVIAVTLVLIVTAFIFIYFNTTNATVAATDGKIKIQVNKVTTVSIYAFGSGVELVESNNDFDLYTATVGSKVILQAVNETRIFEKWLISKIDNAQEGVIPTFSDDDSISSIVNFNVTEDMSDLLVSVNRRNAASEDYGKYMMDRYVIVSEEDFIALQNIIAGNGTNDDFGLYYDNASLYDTPEEKEKIREEMRVGYYLISNNFTIFNEKFTGIGTKDKPFEGIMCGDNGTNSHIFLTITDTEQVGESSYGLFKYLGRKSLIRNLNLSTSIGINESSESDDNTIIYAGGLAGYMQGSKLIDVKVSTSIGIESSISKEIYAGGLFGKMDSGSGIDSISDVVYDGKDSKWSITSHKEDSTIYSGYVAGNAVDSYIKEMDMIVTNQVVDLKNDSVTSKYTSSKLYLGSVFGSYNAISNNTTIDDLMIMGDNKAELRAVTTNGDAMVGGLIGYVDANNQNGILNLGRVYFRILNGESQFSASSIKTSDVTNLYSGGLVGYVNGNNFKGTSIFKNRLEEFSGVTFANYLFEGLYKITSIQNGKTTANTNGKSISGGIIGCGIMDIEGVDDANRSEIAIASPTSSFSVEAVQSQLAAYGGPNQNGAKNNDKEHACAALIFATVSGKSIDISNINVYTNNTTIKTKREIGTQTVGDLHTGGFIGFASASNFSNIGLYFNNSLIKTESLSYEGKNTNTDTNSAFCGGFTGELYGNSKLLNIIFAGYDKSDFKVIGTTSNLESIQNTIPGGGDYKGENYIGGMVGRIKHATIENCTYKGSESVKNFIKMSGHESPDSAFCGGIVGLIQKNESNTDSSIINCEVSHTDISGNATCIDKAIGNPDIYIGGIVGAAYMHGTNNSVVISDCHVYYSTVYALGNEIIATYAGGIIGGATWESSLSISDCYVFECEIESTTSTTMNDNNVIESSAAGIVALIGAGTNITISNSVVIDTSIESNVESNYTYISSYASGISGFTEKANIKPTLKNCYTNAVVKSSHQNSSATSRVYAVSYNATIETASKAISTTSMVRTYKSFTLNGYTFEVVNAQSGTYRIKTGNQYARIGGFSLDYTTDLTRATSFTMNNNNLIYSGRYINFNYQRLTYGYSAYDFSSVSYYEDTTVEAEQQITSLQTYYLSKNVKNKSDNYGTGVGTGPFNIPETGSVNPYGNYNYLYGFDGTGQKFYIEILDSTAFIVNREENKVISVSNNPSSADTTALAHVWINATENGNMSVPNHDDKISSANDGWFIFDYVLLYSGSLVEIQSDIASVDTTYTKDKKEYDYHYDSINDKHYLENKNNSSDKIFNNYIEHGKVDTNMEYTFKVYDDMLTFNADLEITHFGASYKLLFADESYNVIDDADFKNNYGDISLNLLQKHSSFNNDLYRLTFDIKEDIEEDVTFYIRFIGGNNTIQSETSLKINLIANDLQLIGATYAEYTPPINYYEDNSTLGTSGHPYHLHTGSITKFIPIFKKQNDLDSDKVYILEDYIEKCNYTIDNTTDLYYDINSSGELKTGTTANQNGVLNISYDSTTITIYMKSVKEINVSYSIVGALVTGITKASDTADFYFEQHIRSNYGGVPTSFKISFDNGSSFDLKENINTIEGIKIYEINQDGSVNNTPITNFDINSHGYLVRVNNSLLSDVNNINVEIDYPLIYIISFKLQCESFNSSVTKENLSRAYKIESGTSFKEFFNTIVDGKTIKEDILAWAKNAEIFGYVFTGFYLVNDASSINSYGVGFEELTNSEYLVNSSNEFYGRWSYLIELVEASGTHIKTGFNSSFLQEYKEDGFNRTIQIPINTNQGYIFRVDTDDYYVGKAGVEAFVVTLDNIGNKVLNPIEIEMYSDSDSLYYISPNKITGYLVVMTTVSSSEIIVGEHTSSVTENITPEDGIITFKYIVNHYNDGNNKSFIYNLEGLHDYSTLKKEFVLDFYKESDHSIVLLPDNTEITVYYNRYDNGSKVPSMSLVGKYITNNDDRVYLTEFKALDLETNIFKDNITFKDSLGENKSVSEVYYFTITPPNGYSEKVHHEMANYVVECGYVVEKVDYNEPVEFLKGKRNELELANPELNDVVSNTKSFETSKQYKYYHSIPSRNTNIEKNSDGTFTFTDDLTYSIYDIVLTDTQKFNDFNYISLYDDSRQSLLQTTKMSFPIKELRLSLGYRLGDVNIYGMKEDSSVWEIVETINVNSAISTEYVIDFKDNLGEYSYYAYMIDNISTNEIRVYQLDVVSNSNGVLYEGLMSNIIEKEIINSQHVYSLTHQIVGDSRHDGKSFMLGVQLVDESDPSVIISDMPNEIYITVNHIGLGTPHYVYLDNSYGKTVGFINLSKIKQELNVNSFNFTINIPDGYQIYAIQLLEVTNEFKPASGEVRIEWPKILEFAGRFMSDFNLSVNNNNTSISHFYDTSEDNFKMIVNDYEMLSKYKWFFEFIRNEINDKATNNSLLTEDEYLNTINLLDKMIAKESIDTALYTKGMELLRYFIDALFNERTIEEINSITLYKDYLVDYSSKTNMNRFLEKYDINK